MPPTNVEEDDSLGLFPYPGTRAATVREWMDENKESVGAAARKLSFRVGMFPRHSLNGSGRSASYEPPEGTRARKYYLQLKGHSH